MAPRVRESIGVIWDAFPTSLKKMAWATIGLGWAAAAMEGVFVVVIYVFMATLANNLELPSGRAFDWLPEFVHSFDATALITSLGLITIAVIVGKSAIVFASNALVSAFVHRARAVLSRELLNRTLCRPYANIAGESDGAVRHSLMAETDIVCTQIIQHLVVIIIEASVLTGLVVVLGLKSFAVTLWSALLLMTIGSIVYLSFRGFGQRLGRRVNQFEKERANRYLNTLDGLKTVKTTNSQDVFVAMVDEANRRYLRAQLQRHVLFQTPRLVLETVGISLLIGTVLIASNVATAPAEVIGMLSLFAAAAYRMMPSVVRLNSAMVDMRVARAPLESLSKRLSQAMVEAVPRQFPVAVLPDDFGKLPPRIEVDGVNYSFVRDGQRALEGVSFDVPPGGMVGVIGPNGSGKSTLIDLMLGLREPASGNIRAAGFTLSEIGAERWHALVGFVPQSIFVLPTTVEENVAFGVPKTDIDHARVQRALETVRLEWLPERFSGCDGSEAEPRLSGGERQRLAIARALYRQPKVLVLDEATSALDRDAEEQVAQAIGHLKGSVTMIVVAHKLDVLKHCDVIVRLADGKIVESTSYADLSSRL